MAVTGPVNDALSAAGIAAVVDLGHVPFGNSFFPTAKCGGAPYSPDKRHCWCKVCQESASPAADCFEGTVVAQHGEEEYEADKVQACAKSLTSGEDWSKRYWPFIVCSEKSYPAGPSACAKEAGIDAAALESCAAGLDGLAAVVRAAKATVDHPGTPFITVDGVSIQPADLLDAVCKAYKGPAPAGCASVGAVARDPLPCKAGTKKCEYLPGKVECCTPGESCIPKVGCRC